MVLDTSSFVVFVLAYIIIYALIFSIVVPKEKEGHIYRRKSWIIAGLLLTTFMAGYAVARAKQNRKIGFITFLFVSWIMNLNWFSGWIIGLVIIYWGWNQLPEERKIYTLREQKNN